MISTESIRYAARSLRRSRGFVVTALLTLGAALGLTTTMYGVLDTVRHPYTPYRDPEHVYRIRSWAGDYRAVTLRDRYEALRAAIHGASGIAAESGGEAVAEVAGGAQQVSVGSVTPEYFTVTGFTAVLGRVFDSTDVPLTVVLTQDLWRKWFPGRAKLDGATVALDGVSYAVVGVIKSGTPEQVYVPLPRNQSFVATILRAKPGVTERMIQADLDFVAQRLNAEHPTTRSRYAFELSNGVPRADFYTQFHLVLAATGIVILLIACTNVGNLMLVRGVARRREIALQFALGASRWRVVAQMVWEAALLAAAGAVIGLLLGIWGFDLIVHQVPANIRGGIRLGTPSFNWRVLAFVVVTSVIITVLVGLLPALRSSHVDVSEPLKEQSGTTTGRVRGRYSVFAIGELALAMTLLMAAGLLVRALTHVSVEHFGYETRELATLMVSGRSVDSTVFQRAIELASRQPGVLSAAGVLNAGTGTLLSDMSGAPLEIRGTQSFGVSPSFHETIGIPIIRGRPFADGDAGTNVAIVDDTAAARLWPGLDPVGRMVKLGTFRSTAAWYRVVGVARSVQVYLRDPFDPVPPVVYVPAAVSNRFFQVVIRVQKGGPIVSANAARAIQAALSIRAFPNVGMWRQGFEEREANTQFLAGLFTSLGAFALGLSVVGLYGVLAYAVGRRSREYAVRIALGSTERALFTLVMHDAAVMILAGTGIGAFLAMWGAKRLVWWLYDVQPTDAWALVASELVLVLVAFLACLTPARRAMKADPAEILRAV